jgi:hypothetical protein
LTVLAQRYILRAKFAGFSIFQTHISRVTGQFSPTLYTWSVEPLCPLAESPDKLYPWSVEPLRPFAESPDQSSGNNNVLNCLVSDF